MIEPETQIPVTLSAQQWNLVLAQLADGPYRLVAPILNAIQQQCMAYESTPEGQVVPFNAAQ